MLSPTAPRVFLSAWHLFQAPDVFPDTGREYSFQHHGLCTCSSQPLLLLSSLLLTPGLLPLETMKIYMFALHSNYTSSLKKNISLLSHIPVESGVSDISPTLFFNVTGNQASLTHRILYRAACPVANSWLSIQLSLVAWFICISSSQRITSPLSVLKCGT